MVKNESSSQRRVKMKNNEKKRRKIKEKKKEKRRLKLKTEEGSLSLEKKREKGMSEQFEILRRIEKTALLEDFVN